MNKYIQIVLLFGAAILVNFFAPQIISLIHHLPEGAEQSIAMTLLGTSIILGFGWWSAEVSDNINNKIPSFALQLLVAITMNGMLKLTITSTILIVVICTLLAIKILKIGGDEVERRNIKNIALPTIMLAIPGYLITFFICFILFTQIMGLNPLLAALFPAIIGSTDPAALIPTFKGFSFKQEHKKLVDISVAESAINDAVGAIFTGAIILMIQNGVVIDSLGTLTKGLFSADSMVHLGKQFLFGGIVGLVFGKLFYFYQEHKSKKQETSYDFALVLLFPFITGLIAMLLHGNPFLAAFVCGLVGDYEHHNKNFHKTLKVMETKMDSISKPVIFMMAGPLVGWGDIVQYLLPGLGCTALFLIARAIAVHLSLLPTKLTMSERNFMVAVRETGVLPIVLTVLTIAALPNVPELKPLMSLVAIVVLITLVVLPAVTYIWAKFLDLTEEKSYVS